MTSVGLSLFNYLDDARSNKLKIILCVSEHRPDPRDPSLIQVFIFRTSLLAIWIVVPVAYYMLIIGGLDTVHCLS